ncbi:hypothetical protein [Cesiribacter sp. SM1]|uniref:hypothetical protein n=1 Tax=Cesiribacter sp. SM1 TaxID=2861196 RepID=UPI001CD42422|nr:hypothetical protein [Cesiribacter sp. SM1]
MAQIPVEFKGFNKKGAVSAILNDNILTISWPAGQTEKAKLLINLEQGQPLFESIQLSQGEGFEEIAAGLDPAFILTIGERDLKKRGGWNIFFDETAYKPYKSYTVDLDKRKASVRSQGSRTNIIISEVKAGHFTGSLEITLYNGSPLLNMAAVVATNKDSVAIIYDAGLIGNETSWEEIFWADTEDYLQSSSVDVNTESQNIAVKYRTIMGETDKGSIAIFPPPHQYFYPLDNAYNLKYTWYGSNYRQLIPEFGLGIRHELLGDQRHVPWFNAPPNTRQRLNYFILISTKKDGKVLEEVKQFTHGDAYKPLPEYYTMASHFHTEHVMDVLTHKPLPQIPGHVKALRKAGVNIMHLGEFHLAGNPHDRGPRRLLEFRKMFEECARLSGGDFLMLPGEEPNSHFGGHWMNLFPKPVYWVMSRDADEPFVEEVPEYGKVYRVGNREEMLKLLEVENGLAWTAHARIKGSTGFPDGYREEVFFKSDRFLGAAWKAMPADLSQDRLGKRVLDVMDDMANWGLKKYVIAEADLFKIEPDYELYANLNINYLQLNELPKFEEGWQPVLDAMENGKFFVSTGEVLLPAFSVNGKKSGETTKLNKNKKAEVVLEVDWTFPLSYAEIISGDGEQVFRQRINLDHTQAFGKQKFVFTSDLQARKWVRVEVWDVAANGAFTQFVWIE